MWPSQGLGLAFLIQHLKICGGYWGVDCGDFPEVWILGWIAKFPDTTELLRRCHEPTRRAFEVRVFWHRLTVWPFRQRILINIVARTGLEQITKGHQADYLHRHVTVLRPRPAWQWTGWKPISFEQDARLRDILSILSIHDPSMIHITYPFLRWQQDNLAGGGCLPVRAHWALNTALDIPGAKRPFANDTWAQIAPFHYQTRLEVLSVPLAAMHVANASVCKWWYLQWLQNNCKTKRASCGSYAIGSSFPCCLLVFGTVVTCRQWELLHFQIGFVCACTAATLNLIWVSFADLLWSSKLLLLCVLHLVLISIQQFLVGATRDFQTCPRYFHMFSVTSFLALT